jgi:hypothetical protein
MTKRVWVGPGTVLLGVVISALALGQESSMTRKGAHDDPHIRQAGQSPIRVLGGSIEFYAKYGWQLVDPKCNQTASPNTCSYKSIYFTEISPSPAMPSYVYFDDFVSTHREKPYPIGNKKWQIDFYAQAIATSPAVTICSAGKNGDYSQCNNGFGVLLKVGQQPPSTPIGFYSVINKQTPPALFFRYDGCAPGPDADGHCEDLEHVVISIDGASPQPGQCPRGGCAVGLQ